MSDKNDPGCPPWPKNKQSKDERIAELEGEVTQLKVDVEALTYIEPVCGSYGRDGTGHLFEWDSKQKIWEVSDD